MPPRRTTTVNRRWRLYLGLVALTIGLGLPARLIGRHLPQWYVLYAGDFLWAVLVYLLLALGLRTTTRRTLGVALATTWAVELSQLYHAPWIDSLRAIPPFALVFGRGFLWSDLVAYAAGVVVAAAVDAVMTRDPGRARALT